MSQASIRPEILQKWMSRQRWYTGKGSDPELRMIGSWSLPGTEGVSLSTLLIMDDSTTPATLYQVPVSLRTAPEFELEPYAITTISDPGGGKAYLYDAPNDPIFTRQLLALIVRGGVGAGVRMSVAGHAIQPLDIRSSSSRVLRGEQSNTSIVYSVTTVDNAVHSLVCKIFRALHPGDNPDVVLQSALSTARSTRVPASVGTLSGEWDDVGTPSGRASGHLVFAQEFLSNARDAWDAALDYAASGTDFTAQAAEIGRATADIHATLATALPTRPTHLSDVAATVETWRRRFDEALTAAPGLAAYRAAIDDLYGRASLATWPDLQRIHGDLHLGQILLTESGRCVIIDFEGEPLRPMNERSVPDIPLRDVAGMLRSFDYVAGARPDAPNVQAWTAACRAAFLDGYTSASGTDLDAHRVLLDAFEADKALYEAVYEARNRPDWLRIPVDAIRRLAGRN